MLNEILFLKVALYAFLAISFIFLKEYRIDLILDLNNINIQLKTTKHNITYLL